MNVLLVLLGVHINLERKQGPDLPNRLIWNWLWLSHHSAVMTQSDNNIYASLSYNQLTLELK